MEKSFTMKKGADTIYSSTHVLEKRETSKNALWKSLSISIMMLVGLTMNAQVTVTGDAAGTYADLGAAITALNAITGATLTQNTVVTVAAGNAQTAPVGGYVVNVTGTSTASLSFVGNGNTISTPVQTANGILDAAIMFIGSDFVTISGFTINASAGTVKVPASNDRTEWGIAFMAASATNGCWNNTVINNTIQMGAAYVNSRGVYFGCTHSPTNATTAQLATASSGTNSFNIVRQNIIDSASVGVMFLSSPNTAAIIETGNKVSLNTITLACHDAGTIGSATGTISSLYNLSNTTARLVGVEFRNGVTGFTVDSNTITAATPVFTNTTTVNAFYNFRGVSSSASTNPTGFIGAPNLYRGNTITYASVNNSTGGTTGIEAVVTPTTPMISNIAIRNTINLTYTSNGLTSTAQTQGMFGIDMGVAGQKTSRADSNIVTLTRTMNGNGTFGTSQMTGIAVGGISTSPLATTLDTSSASNNIVTIKQFATSTTINSSTQATNFIDIKQGNGFAIANDNILTTGNDSLNTTSTNNGIVLNSGFSQAVEVNRNIINVNSTMSPVSTFGTQFIGINNQFFASTALISFNINDNKIKFFGRKGFVGINCNDGTTTSVAMKNVLRNKIDADIQRINISVAPTSTGMSFSAGKGFNIQFDTIVRIKARSAVTGTTAGSTTITGITIGSPSIAGVSTVVCSNNIIDSLVTEIGGTTLAHTTRGISSTTGTGLSSTIENNRITNLIISPAAAVTGNGILNGISHSGAVPTTISKNRLTNLVNTSTGVTATNIGVLLSSTSGVQTTVNNIISDLAGCGNNPNGTIGMNFTGAATNNVYYNTVYMRNLSSIFSNYGATGIMIPNNTGAMDIKNNIIHLENAASNAGPLGTGTYAALRVGAAGTPGVPPTNLSATNNIYFTPAISNSFLYAEGLVAGTLASLTDTFTLSGDPAFNQSCGTYKTFMGAKDLGSVTANIPVTVTNGVVTPTSTPNLADNNALAIASVTTDFNNTTRGTFPDIGAVEFTSTAPIDQAGPVINFASLPNLACFNQQVLTATITDNSGINTTTAKPRLYYRKKTDATTFGANTSAGTGWKFVEPSNTTSPFTFTMDYSLLTAAPAVGDSIEYFVVAQDNVGTANVSGKTVALTPSNTCLTSVNLATVVGLTDALGGNTFTFLAQPTITFDVKKNPICSGLTDTVKGTLTQSGNINIGNTITTGTGTGQSIFAGGWGGTKSQYIIRASELTAQGLSGGPITAIGFTPTTSASTYEGVQLWIGHTALAAFANTTFIDTLAQTKVFEAPGALAAFTPTANTLNTFTFGTTGTPTLGSPVSSSFVWDGVSNIVLTFCHSENPTAGNVTASSMQFHVPGFICAITRQNDNQSMSAMLGATGSATNTNRPNFVISGNKAPVVSSAINPSSGYAWNTGATTQTFFPNPATVPTTTYKLTITDISGCQVNDSTNITVDPLPAAPTTTSISKCGLAPSTTTVVTDATTPAITGPIFKWYKTSTSTTVLQASTDAFYNGNSPAFGTDTFFISVTNPTTTCEGPRTMMVYTSTAPPDTIAPTINMMVDSAKICEGASVSLNVTQGPGTSFTSFTWFSDSTQAGANPSLTGAAQSVTPTNPGTYIYRVTASGGGCTVNKTVKVIVDKDFFAIAPTAIQSDTNLACIGTILNHKYGQGGAGAAPTYPASGATTTGDEEILRVTFGTIDNITSCPQPGLVGSQGTGVQVGTNGQINFTGSTVPVPLLVPGVSNNLTVQIGTCGGNFGNMTKAFFDWNQDGDFLDAGEEFLLTPVFINGPNTTAPFAITTPLNATFGKTRMRIVNVETTVATGVTSNTTYAFGETEDYEVQVGIPNLTYQWTSNKSGATILSDSSKLVQTLNDTLITYQLVTKSGACTDTATNTITGIPLPLAPTAVTINKCGIGVNTSNAVTDVSVPVISQPIFKWYAAATGGVALQSDTFRFWNSTTSIGTDSFFVSVANPLGGCEGPRTKVTYVTTAATDTILPRVNGIATDSIAVCEGSTLNFTVTQGPGTTYTSFSWFSDSVASGANPALTGATQSVAPTAPGTYIYTINASGGACSASKSIKVKVGFNFFNITPLNITSDTNIVCINTLMNFKANVSSVQPGGSTTPPLACITTGAPLGNGDEEILGVKYKTINNNTTCATPLVGTQGTGVAPSANDFIDFTNSAVPMPILPLGDIDTVEVNVGTCGGNFASFTNVFFDWNQDGDFVDPGERFFTGTAGITGPHVIKIAVTVPATAAGGVTRMRVMNIEGGNNTSSPCTIFGFGETEDYKVQVGIPGLTFQWTSDSTGATILSDSNKLKSVINKSINEYYLTASVGGCVAIDSISITGDPLPAAPLAVAKTKCGVGADTSAVVSDATSPLLAGPIFKWYKTATSTTVLQNDILRFWNGSTVLGNDTFFVSTFNQATGCEGPRSMMIYTTTTPPDTIAPKVNGIADSTAICEGSNLILSVTQGPGTSFTSFTWFSDSLNSGANPAIAGATNTVVPGSVGVYTYKVTASGGGCIVSKDVKVRVDKNFFAIAPTSFTSNPNPACVGTQITNSYAQGGAGVTPTYPASGATTTGDEEILRVTFGAIDNITTCPQPGLVGSQGTGVQVGTNGHINFTGSAVPIPLLVPGQSNNITVQVGTCGGNFNSMTKAFFDWNQDGDFVDPGEEFLLTPASINGPHTTTPFSITTPLNATFGVTRMRIVNVETTVATGVTSNTTFGFGETEDYSVRVGIPGITYQWTSSKTGATVLSDSSKLIIPLADTSVDYVLVTKSGACTDTAVNTVTDNVPALVSNPIVGPVDATSCDTVSLKGTSTGGCGPYTYAWTSANANFVTATNDSVVRFLLTGTSGAKTVKLVITDNLGAKDSFTQTITLTSPQLLTTTPDTICGTQTASLAATVNTGSDIKWYNSASINDTILATGSPFVTPLLSGTDTFFVEASADGALQFAARPTAPAASFASGSNNIGLKFKTTKPIVLDSVDVFAGTATSTSLTIGLFVEGSATPIKTTTVATTGGTKVLSSVELGWTITPGTYRILRTAASSSYHRETGMATSPYPMKLGSSGSIDSGVNSVTGAASALEYNLFYNWRIKEVCTTPRTAVIVNSVSAPALTLNKSMDSMCSGLVSDTVKLTSNVSDYNTYTWAPATGIAGAANAWVVNETTPGTYKYILTGTQTSSLGCVNKDTLDFIVKTIPAAFTIAPAGPLTLCNGTAQQLVAPSGTSTMTWSSNTGLFSNASATTAYAGTDRDTVWAAPTDTVKYFATATHPNGCTRKDSIVINVTDSVSFTTQAPVLTELCAGQALSLAPVASSTSPITYQWKKNNVNITNTTSSLSIPTTVVADGGLYTLEATTGTPCSAKLSDTMRVTVFPGLSITTQPNATGTLTICQGQPFTLTSAATGQATMQWRKIVSGTTSNYGVLNDQDTTIASSTLVDSGLYFVQYTLGGTCGTAVSDTVKVTIVPAAFVSTDPIGDTICAGQNVTFTATTQNASGFAWTKNGTTISAGGNITITNTGSTQSVLTISNATATDAGNYRLIALNVGSCVADTSAIATLGINAKPSIASTTLPAATICAGSTMSFAVTASNNSRVVWFGGATGTDSIQNATSFTLSATAGIYSVKVIGNSPCGDTTSASVTTTVTPLSTITKPVLTSNPICAGSTTTVSANFTNADSVVWFQGSTRLGLGTVAGSTSTFTVSTAGTYTARAYSANGCLNVDSTSATLAINPKPAISSTTLPAATVCAGSTMSFAVTASNNSRVVWFGGATGTDSIQNATSFTLPATAGVYSVKVIGNSPCGDTTSASVTTTVTPLASITTQPSATTVCQGSAMSFTIAASNADSIVWFRGATRVGTGTSYNVTSATSADSANYSAVAYSAAGCTNATSNVVLGAVKPQATITTQPVANTYVLTGTNASVSVSASNFDSVVWFKGATRISNGATLSITNFDSATHAGKYTARVYSQAPCTNFIVSDTANIIKSTCPVITTQPIGDTLCIGSTYALSVTAGAVNTYEWYKVGNATPIASTSSTTLNLNALTSGGRYFVKLTPLTGCTTTVTSDTVNVGVDDSTKITAQPTASTTICEGSALNLSVTATGSGTLSYQWMNGSTNVGTNSNSYSVSSAATTDAGTYKVMVSSTSACPSATSSNAVVNVTPAATITTQPSSSTICEGSTLSFTIAANNADSIVWFNGTTRVGTGATFSQTNAQTTNSGNYVAIAYRGAGCSNVSSNSVAGTVNAAPAITTQPTSSAFGCNGSNFNSLSVVASNATSYQWKQGSTNKGGTSATISISPFTVSDTGNYTVVVSGTAPCADVTSTIANVKITDTAKIVTQPASLTDVCVGGTLRLKVVGNGAASYQWYKGTTAISGETKDSLVIANVAAATAGTYKVEAIAFAGCVNTTSSNAVVTISTPVTFTTQPAASTICAGGTINLSTAVSGNSSPTYVWKKDGVALGAPSSTGFSKSSAMLSDSGNYTVEVTGAASCPTIVSNTAKVTINAAPTITAISGTSPLCVGSTLTLSATATNNNGVIWKKGTATVGTSSTYTKTAATIDAGSYTVTAVGKTGCADVTSAAFTQAITSPASITTQPVSTAVLTGSSFTLSVTASNANTYQWYKDGSSIAGETNASYTVSSFDSALHAGSYTVEITSNSPCTGTITSTAANVTKTTCPVITSQPLSDTLCAGSALNLSVTAVGASGYKWYRNGTPITGATSAIYSVSNATSANSGTYKVEVLPVTGATCPQILSSNVTVLVESTPVITAQPKGNSNCAPTTHTLRVATSTTGHSYQWFKNGVAVSGATLDSLNITSIIPVGDKYFVTMSGTGVCPSVSSDTVTVISRNPQTQVRLVTNSEQNLVEQCTENNWTYYAKAGVPNEFLLAIRKNGNDVMFAPDIEINPAGITTLQHTANNPNGAIFGRRFFNIDLISGTLQYPYDVKFYYAPADTLEVITKLAQLKAANASVTASRPSSSWITSTLVPFTSSLLSGVTSAPVGFANTIVSANSNGKDNQVDYVEITNLVAKNGGGTMFMDYTISSGSGISDKVNKGFGIEMYPVPATTELNVRLTSNTFKPVSFTITDMNGKVVMSSEERHQSNTSDHKFDISSFANGVYHIQLTNGETQSAAKFTVSK